MDSVVSAFISFWGFLSNVMTFAGIIVIPATFYGVLECVKMPLRARSRANIRKPSSGRRSALF